MKIINYFYKKYLLSCFITLFFCLLIFFIFSLIINLSENYYFDKILLLSILNSFQIIFYIPSLIFILTVFIFVIILKTKNEIIIIRSYLSYRIIVICLLPAIITLALLQTNKLKITDLFDDLKLSLVGDNSFIESELIVENYHDYKIYYLLKGMNFDEESINSFSKYIVKENKISQGLFGENIFLDNGKLIAKNLLEYENEIFQTKSLQEVYQGNLSMLINSDKTSKINENYNFHLIISSILDFFYFSFFNLCIFLLFLKKTVIEPKGKFTYPLIYGTLLLVYLMVILNVDFISFNELSSFLSLFLFLLIFYKTYKYD